jgi:NAD(P)-dependent dehydrogenase (short-subunit alcohol dehydrogenase family)
VVPTEAMPQQTWFVTGSSRGFGRALTEAALAIGDRVVATARRPEDLSDLANTHGQDVLLVPLDVTDPAAVDAAFRTGIEQFGRLDVVVNNAGYANLAPIETGDEDDFRQQFETNFWGAYHVSKLAVGHFRRQGGGLLVQFSSIGGRIGGSPGLASYQAAKFAVEGFTRSLAVETAPFGIRTLVIEPSGFATDWAGSSMTVHDIPEDYDATIGVMQQRVRANPAGPAGDPMRAAKIIVQVAKRRVIPSHLLLGVNAVDMALNYSQQQLDQARSWEQVSRSADYAETYPAAFPSESSES